ncbi:MAG: SagB/ThcOx family dehydrogenase [Anaerolineae bacterium]|jgi:SagB-type dehydrogenase family enzyme
MSDTWEQVVDYHQATKHRFDGFAKGPGYMDWATQPDPFRRYQGARLIQLERPEPGEDPAYGPAFSWGHVEPVALDRTCVSQLFFDSLSISAWKRAGDTTWALRVNPSSGNLHPTEGYLISGPVTDLVDRPMVGHYAPREHALEVRSEFSLELWQQLVAPLPAGTLLVGLTSIHWREAWKYGERAFRYCQHDVGHAIAAVSIAAAGLGWQATLLDDLGSDQIARLLGVSNSQGAEAEHPDCVLAIYPQDQTCERNFLSGGPLAAFADLTWRGEPNQLSPRHRPWPVIDQVAAATAKPPTAGAYSRPSSPAGPSGFGDTRPFGLRQMIRQRRSAVAMDPNGSIGRDAFYRILNKTIPGPGRLPFDTLPWRPRVHLLLFVHRVEGLEPGLYLLLRQVEPTAVLQDAMKDEFLWERPESCPPDMHLYRLARGDARNAARLLSCQQDIAADGCFSVGMLAEFEDPLGRIGPWFYRRLFWECGVIGQVLYLEAEAAGVRGTGIGCYFDDPVHDLLGLQTRQYQSLYHFTVGHPIEDARLTTLPAYPPGPASGRS